MASRGEVPIREVARESSRHNAARFVLFLWALLSLSGCARPESPTDSSHLLVDEAKKFMEEYSAELVRKDRPALVGRYDSRGVFFVGEGTKEFWSADSVSAWYRKHWPGPAYFQFKDLSYEPLGDSSIAVLGQFRWTEAGKADTVTFAYTAILVRQGGRLVIRVEDESKADPVR